MKKIEFEIYPTHTLHYGLFDKVTNAGEILNDLLAGKINFALLNPQLVYISLLLSCFSSFSSSF